MGGGGDSRSGEMTRVGAQEKERARERSSEREREREKYIYEKCVGGR